MSYFAVVDVAYGTNVPGLLPLTNNFDGITLGAGQTILLIGQTNPVENGLYVFNGPGFQMTRVVGGPSPFAQGNVVPNYATLTFSQGNQLAGQRWIVTQPPTGTITTGTTPMVFTPDALGPSGPSGLLVTNGVNVDVNGGKVDYLEINSTALTAPFQIGGFSDCIPGLERTIFNPSLFPMTLLHESSAEANAASRIHNPNGGNVACSVAVLRYSPAIQRWVIVSTDCPWTPLSMTDLAGWWRSDAVALDGTGTLVTTAFDVSGNGCHASAGGGAQPTFTPSGGPNGRPFWTGSSGTALANTATNLLATSRDHTVFAAFQLTGAGGSLLSLRVSGQCNVKSYQQYGGANYVYTDGVHGADNATVASLTQNSALVYSAISQVGSLLSMRINGVTVPVTANGPITADTGGTGFVVAGRLDYPGMGLVGQFYEMFVIGHAATAAEIALAENYLQARWG